MKVCFFTRTKGAPLFETVGFFADDLRMLRDLGHDVVAAGRVGEIDWSADLYFSWFPYWALLAAPAALLRRKPHLIVGTLDAAVPARVRNRGLRQACLLLMERLAVRLCTATLPISNYEAEFFRRLGARRPTTVYCCVNVGRYAMRAGPPSSPPLLLLLSRLTEANYRRKCVGQVIESVPGVLASFPEARYLLFGSVHDPTVVDRIRSRTRALGVERNVEVLTRHVDEAEKIAFMQASTVYLQPTLHEGFGLAIAEAMSCGVPVVTSRSGSVPEVAGDCAVYCDPDDPADIAAQTIALLKDEPLQRELGARGRRRVEALFAYERRRDALERIMRELPG